MGWLGAALFALHPLQVEAVALVQQRHVVLGSLHPDEEAEALTREVWTTIGPA